MAREKKKAPAPAHGVAAANRRAKMERAMQYSDTVWRTLNPLKPQPKIGHKTHFELVENADKKKKKLEFEITTSREPPPGFEFIPTGHPELSHECKEQSRDSEAMYFIVSNSKDPQKLDHHMNRLGYHFRHTIVEEARKVLQQRGHHEQAAYVHEPGKPEPIPKSQSEIDQEADAVLRDLFPRIPNTDRQEIVDHAFKKDGTFNGEFKVGMAKDLTLARRVQLAALAHIRHTHTRYDELLKESDWANARKAVEKPCLDIIVKWRGDEETGRDQLDEILREVIEISDTENESEDESSGADNARTHVPRTTSAAISTPLEVVPRLSRAHNQQIGLSTLTSSSSAAGHYTSPKQRGLTKAERRAARKTARKTQQRFKRYAAAAEALANTSNKDGHPESHSTPRFVASPMEVVRSQGSGHPVNTNPITPSAVTREAYTPRHPSRQTEVQRMPVPESNGFTQDRVADTSCSPFVHTGTQQFIRVPDTRRPKVGPYSAIYTQPRPLPPLSPVRIGLQDMLLPSIEPRSPDSSRILQDVSQRLHREPRQLTEVPRVISRTIAESAVPGSRPRSPDTLVDDDELAAKRRRVITYFPEDFQRPPNSSYVRVARQGQNENLRRPQYEYLTHRQPLASRVPEHVVYQDVSRTPFTHGVRVVGPGDGPDSSRSHPLSVSGDDQSLSASRFSDRAMYQGNLRVHAHHDYPVDRVEAPLRSRANPIVIAGDNNYEARHVVEVRGSPAHETYRTVSPTRNGIHDLHMQRDPRIQDPLRVVYVDEPNGHVRNEPSSHHRMVPYSLSGHPTYQEVQPWPQSPDITAQPRNHTVEQPTRYAIPYERQVRATEPQHISLARPSAISRGIQAPLPEAPQYTNFGSVQQAAQHQPRDNLIYRGIRSSVIEPADVRYGPEPYQPFPVYPAASSYVEIRGPPAHQRMPDHRDIIYVE